MLLAFSLPSVFSDDFFHLRVYNIRLKTKTRSNEQATTTKILKKLSLNSLEVGRIMQKNLEGKLLLLGWA